MNNNYSVQLEKTFAELHENSYSSLSLVRADSPDLYQRLLTDLYNFVCHVAYNTSSNQLKLTSYAHKHGTSDTAYMNIGIKHGDLVHDFYLKMLSPITKGKNKNILWLDSLFKNTPYEYWIQTLQLSANNFLTDKLKANTPSSLDEKLSNCSEDEFCVGDIVVKMTPHHPEYSCESEAIAHTINEKILSLLTDATQLIAYSEAYNGAFRSIKSVDQIQALRDPKAITLAAIQSLLPTYKNQSFALLMENIDFSSIDELIHIPRSKAAKKLTQALTSARKKIITQYA